LIDSGLLVLEKKIFKKFQCILLFRYYLPLKKDIPLPLSKFESLLPKDDLYQVWLKLTQWFWRRRSFNDPTPFLQYCDYLTFEEDLALYLYKLEFPLPKNNLYHVWLNLACWFWRRFLNIFSAFSLFRYYIPLEKGYPLHLNKLESPSPKDDVYQVWLKLAQWFWRKRFLNDPIPFLHFCDYLPLEEELVLYLNELEFPLPKDNLY
jgi:hypothetical protein